MGMLYEFEFQREPIVSEGEMYTIRAQVMGGRVHDIQVYNDHGMSVDVTEDQWCEFYNAAKTFIGGEK